MNFRQLRIENILYPTSLSRYSHPEIVNSSSIGVGKLAKIVKTENKEKNLARSLGVLMVRSARLIRRVKDFTVPG